MTRSLALRRETVRTLVGNALLRVRGGSADPNDDGNPAGMQSFARVCVAESENCDVIDGLVGLGGTTAIVTYTK